MVVTKNPWVNSKVVKIFNYQLNKIMHSVKHMWKANLFFMLIGIALVIVMILVVRTETASSSTGKLSEKENTTEPVKTAKTDVKTSPKPVSKVPKVHNSKVSKTAASKTALSLKPYFSTVNSEGRFGNHFFRNMYWHSLAERNDLNIEYSFQDMFLRLLGWKFYKGKRGRLATHPSTVVKDENMMKYMTDLLAGDEQIETDRYFFGQTREFSQWMRKYFAENNLFPSAKVEPNTVFVHIRLGDMQQTNPGIEYYRNALNNVDFTSGYIASDSPEHKTCVTLLEEFPSLRMVSDKIDEVDTLLLALTQEHAILSQGTFSWLIGFLSPEGTRDIHYPDMPPSWHGDIFVFDDWHREPVEF